ncbi:MAG: M1 family aminopeptidase [Wenzhouxiangellaceae bacterium]|nr:M1 family aminopeptidase [Wenzhouxiangellaceae bacterium]
MNRIFASFFLAVLLAACQAPESDAPTDAATVVDADDSSANGAANDDAAAQPMPVGQLGSAVVPRRYVLDLTIVPARERFSGRVAILVDIREASNRIWLHGKRLNVGEAWLEQGGARIDAEYTQADDTGIARLDLAAVPETGQATLHFVYEAAFDQALEGLYKVIEEDRAYAFTQFEATSARLAFPGFDEPVFKTPFEIHVTAPADEEVITSTAEISSSPVDGGLVRRSYEVTPPLPTYLIAFAVGPLDVVEWEAVPANEIRDWPLPLRGVAAAGKGDQLDFALENTARLVHVLERYFDYAMPYPKLDIIAVPDFAAGAMENAGAITYREQLLLLDEDDSVARQRAYASVHGHELAHQWFGNLVTPKWWDDIWLNESFATWMAARAAHEAFPDLGFEDQILGRAIGVMSADALETTRQVRQAIDSNHDIANAFDGITYSKGGAVLSMFEAWVGEDEFRDGVRLHMQRFAHGVADYKDFLTSLADGAGRPELVDAFSSFLFQPGVPLIAAELSCNDARPELRVSQSRYLPLGSNASRDHSWELPLCVRFGNAESSQRHCTLLDQVESVIDLPTDTCPAWVMPNADGKGYYRFSLDDAGWAALVSNLGRLNDAESRMLLDSVSAAYRSGDMSTEALLEVAEMLAAVDDREVATAPIGDLNFMYERLAETEAARAGIAAMLRDLYAQRLEALGLAAREGDSTDDSLLRATLASLLSDEGRHEPLRQALNTLADDYLEDLDIAADRLDPGLVGTALTVAVQMREREFADALFARALESSDSTFRGRALAALGASEDPEIGAMLRRHIGDPRLRDNEAISIVFAQVGNEARREAIWEWARDESNLQLLLKRIPTWRKGSIVALGSGFCSAERADEVKATFEDRVQDLEGGPRSLAQTLERIHLCAALKDEYAEPVSAYFSTSDGAAP